MKEVKYVYPRKPFSLRKCDMYTFDVYYLEFNEDRYTIESENEIFVRINNSVFHKENIIQNDNIYSLYKFFYTPQELRKIKLNKINNEN